jgi:hypothetical protein
MLTLELSHEIVARRGRFKAVAARQVLEHLQDLDGFFDCVDVLLDDDGYLFIDIPDFGTALKMGDVSALWEEHVSYLTLEVITATLVHYGYEPEEERRYDFSGGAVAVLAKRTGRTGNDGKFARAATALTKYAGSYNGKADEYGKTLREGLSKAGEAGFRIVVYGVGARSCVLVNGLSLGPHIDFAVDDQVERQGKFMPGCSLEIRPPGVLAEDIRPTVCLLAVNNENDAKVTARVKKLLGDQAIVLTLLSPADIHKQLDSLPQA